VWSLDIISSKKGIILGKVFHLLQLCVHILDDHSTLMSQHGLVFGRQSIYANLAMAFQTLDFWEVVLFKRAH